MEYDLRHLSNSEIKELLGMYRSGKYYVHEICEWFGITYYMFRRYIEDEGHR